jgi:hypothetical protein
MPIADEALQKDRNRFIAVKDEAKLGQAIAALTALGGQPWWHLVVQAKDGSCSVARFNEIGASLSASKNAAETRVRDCAVLIPAVVVERSSSETKEAQVLARITPARVVVVTESGIPIGILVEGTTRGPVHPSRSDSRLVAVPTVTLDQLGGKYVKLKDYGSILLGSSKK